MVQIKAWFFYLDIYAESSYKWDRGIYILVAIASSTSIAAGAIWREFNIVWSVIIATSQVITAIKPFFLFSKRLKIIIPFMEDLKAICNKMEYNWYRVRSGDLTEDNINELLFDFKNIYTDIENKNLKGETLVERQDFREKADSKTDMYFENNF